MYANHYEAKTVIQGSRKSVIDRYFKASINKRAHFDHMYTYFHCKLTPHTMANLIIGVLADTPSLLLCAAKCPRCAASQVPQIQFENPSPKELERYIQYHILIQYLKMFKSCLLSI